MQVYSYRRNVGSRHSNYIIALEKRQARIRFVADFFIVKIPYAQTQICYSKRADYFSLQHFVSFINFRIYFFYLQIYLKSKYYDIRAFSHRILT